MWNRKTAEGGSSDGFDCAITAREQFSSTHQIGKCGKERQRVCGVGKLLPCRQKVIVNVYASSCRYSCTEILNERVCLDEFALASPIRIETRDETHQSKNTVPDSAERKF